MKIIPKKNYIIAILIMILTILVLYFLAYIYLERKKVMDKEYMSYLSSIMPEELDNYIVESHDGMIYMANKKNRDIDEFVKKILSKNDYIKDTVYLDLSYVNDDFYDNLYNRYKINKNKIKGNNLAIVKNQKIVKIINLNSDNIERLKENIKNFYEE